MIFFKYLFVLLLAILPHVCHARALDNTGMVPLLSFGGGIFNAFKTPKSGEFQIQYTTALSIAMARPFIGAFTSTRANFYLYAGIGWDLHFSKRLVITPSFAPGVYFQGHDKDLGYPLEFRTCLDIAYKFDNKARLGMQFYHLSNASISQKNPGTECLIFFYSIPINNGI
ncbi:MAG: acyloxyacyl hydrolase [Simkaniaceae bacterium]|nr:acyloxyacyl hydrolase [Simkaniaceae bacterium]MCF7853028.1 acyloxyacyl hydrolase [Simkaniaceae bacterium]